MKSSVVFHVSLWGVKLFQLWIFLYYLQDIVFQRIMEVFDDMKHSYDYVIVGGGSAGCLLAARLSQSPGVSVLLLEAGPEWSSWLADIPAVTPLLQGSAIDWRYHTVPQSGACLALHDNSSSWPRGRALGGSSRLHNLVYLRGHPKDYEDWGDPSWSYPRLLPYFRRLENLQAGAGVPVASLPWETPLASAVLAAGRQLGYSLGDLNGDQQTGFMKTPVSMVRGGRFSIGKEFLKDSQKRPNLKIRTHAVVEKVLFRAGLEAYGVQFLRFGRTYRVRARKGVILSAGTVGSPAILMRSGIGPRQHLLSHQIAVLRDLPVGRSLQDHVTTGLDLVLLNTSLPLGATALASLSAAWDYFVHHTGPWTSPGCEAVAVLHSGLGNSSGEAPDLQLMAVPAGVSSDAGAHLQSTFNIASSVWGEYFAPLSGRQVASLLPVVLHPRSRGEVLLRDLDPHSMPLINPRYLSHPHDVRVLLQGIELVQRLLDTPAMRALGASLVTAPLPGCHALPPLSEDYWRCYVRHLTLTVYHPVGTCKMGPASDPTAVVGPDLRVHGTRGLHVADASVMPSLPSANIHAAVLVIAERAAQLVRQPAAHRSVCCASNPLRPVAACPASQRCPHTSADTMFVRI